MLSAASTIAARVDAGAARRREAEADRFLVERVQAGEVERFDELVDKYRERIWAVIYHMTSNR